jgi:hypothetical protein
MFASVPVSKEINAFYGAVNSGHLALCLYANLVSVGTTPISHFRHIGSCLVMGKNLAQRRLDLRWPIEHTSIGKRSFLPSASARGGMTAGRLRRPLEVSIPVGSLDFPTIVFSDIGDGSFPGGDRKGSFGLGCYPTHMHPRIVQVVGNMGLDDIPGAKSMREVFRLRFGPWKAELVHQTHLAAPMPIRGDEQGHDTLELQGFRGTGSDTRGIAPMGLLQAPGHAIELGTPACPALHWQPQDLQLLI